MFFQSDDSVALESVKYPGQYVGIKPDGEATTPSNTGTGTHSRFIPTLIVQDIIYAKLFSLRSFRIKDGIVLDFIGLLLCLGSWTIGSISFV